MYETIELVLESQDGIIDCRLEPLDGNRGAIYNAVILYPNKNNGYNRSEIYCFNISRANASDNYLFESDENDIPPKIKKLETQLSEAITNFLQSVGNQ